MDWWWWVIIGLFVVAFPFLLMDTWKLEFKVRQQAEADSMQVAAEASRIREKAEADSMQEKAE